MIKIFTSALISGFILSGCTPATVEEFRYTPTAVLCNQLLNPPPRFKWSRYKRAREQALYERGADCSNVHIVKVN